VGPARFGDSSALITAFSAVAIGWVTLYVFRLKDLTDFGVTARLAVRTGCIDFRTLRGVALRTDLRTSLLPKPTVYLPCCSLPIIVRATDQ
jgi:hypothetical protein